MENFLNIITIFFILFITIKFLLYTFKYKDEIEITKDLNRDIRFLSIDSICFSIMSVGWFTKLLMVFGINNYISLYISAGMVFYLLIIYSIFKFTILSMLFEKRNNLNGCLNKVCEVYKTIPEKNKGTGKVLLNLNGNFKLINAYSENEEIKQTSIVKIIKLDYENKTVYVSLVK